MDHSQNNSRQGNGHRSGGGGGRKKASAAANANALAEQHQRNSLLMEAAGLASVVSSAQSNSGGGSRGANNPLAQQQQLAELFAAHQHHAQQQQQSAQLAQHLAALTQNSSQQNPPSSSPSPSSNPLSLLQQQMNAIMQQAPPTSTSGGQNQQSPFNNPAAAWWYLEYLSRIQAAQIIPNLDTQSQTQALAQISQTQAQAQNQNQNQAQAQAQAQAQNQERESNKPQRKKSVNSTSTPPPRQENRQENRQESSRLEREQQRQIEQQRLLHQFQQSQNQRQKPESNQQKRQAKRKIENDPLNLSNNPPPTSQKSPKNLTKIPKLSTTPTLPTNSTPSSSSTNVQIQNHPPPPAAHSTPINLSTPPGKIALKEPPPAHTQVKSAGYTHPILKPPQIGLIGTKTKNQEKTTSGKKKTVASLLAQTRTPPPDRNTPPSLSEISYRPWLLNETELIHPQNLINPQNSKLIIPSLSKSAPDYNLPLKMGWKRETLVRSLEDLINSQNLEGSTVTYTTPTGQKCKSQNEIKKQLNQRTAELTPKHFSFSTSITIGCFIINFENELITLTDQDIKDKNLITKLQILKAEKLLIKEEQKIKKQQEEKDKLDKERKKQHQLLIKSLEICKKNKRRIKLQNERRLKKKQLIIEELKTEDLNDELNLQEFNQDKNLKEIEKLETCLTPTAFSSLLQIYEFLHTFGETLGFDMDSLPNLESLLKGFINHPENEEELQSILIHLIVCAVEDPGMPNPNKHLTPFNQTLKQADVTFGSLSEILRIYLEGISDSEPEAEIYSNWLSEAPFTAHNPGRKTQIVSFLCDVLLQNKAVLKYLEQSTELIHNCKKERQQNDIKIRKLRMFFARKQISAVCEDNNIDNPDKIDIKNELKNEDNEPVSVNLPPPATPLAPMTPLTPAPATPMAQTPLAPSTPQTPLTPQIKEEVSSEGEEESDAKLTMEEIKQKMSSLQNVNEKLKKQMQLNIKNIRTSCLGQDRFRRRFWNLPHSGGVYVEGGSSGEFNELKTKVKHKFDNQVFDEKLFDEKTYKESKEDKRILDCKNAAKIIVENVPEIKEIEQDQENTPPVNTVFEVPPPCIKIFSFLQRETLCSGKPPQIHEKVKIGPTDDELLIKNISKDKWNHYHVLRDNKEIIEFGDSLLDKGVREGGLKSCLNGLNSVFSKKAPDFDDEGLNEMIDEDIDQDLVGVDPDLVYKIHQGLIETLETLEERVASASLQIKGWTLPLPRNQHNNVNLAQCEIIEIVKTRLLDLETAVERRYLKPPLGKSANELNLSNLVGEDNANALNTNENISNGPPCGSTSSTRGQQIQENNKLKELKEKEERLLAANESKNSQSRFLTHWRDAIGKTKSASVLSMAIYLLDSSIAWDKSVMKASCQLCKGGDNEDKLLLCDACDRGYHTYCFKPPLEQIPEGDWFCWECINKATGNRGCIVCGKGNLHGKKLLACDKCVKAYHTDCIFPTVLKVPRGRWYCPDHQTTSSHHHKHHSHSHHTSASSTPSRTSETSSSPSKKKNAPPPTPTITLPPTPPNPIPPPNPPQNPPTIAKPPIIEIPIPVVPITTPIPTPPIVVSISPVPGVIAEVNSPKKNSKKIQRELEQCEKVLDELINHEDAWPFLEPVNTRQFPTYKKVIKTPMDLQTIKKTLTTNTYKSRDQFLNDVRLIFDNCETFNEDDSPVGKAGHSLRVFFESKTFTNTTSCDSNLD